MKETMFDWKLTATSFSSCSTKSLRLSGPSSKCRPRLIQFKSLSTARGFFAASASLYSRPTVDP